MRCNLQSILATLAVALFASCASAAVTQPNNVVVLVKRLAWRGLEARIVPVNVGDPLPHDVDILLGGGGQDAAQGELADDFLAKGPELVAMADDGVIMLTICGTYQLLGHEYELGDERVPGVSLVDLRTVRGEGRLIGDVEITVDLPRLDGTTTGPTALAGFENHGGRTLLGSGEHALGTVVHGYGNDGASGAEGVLHGGNVIGTYLHGPLLPKNTWFADELLARALGTVPGELSPLDDRLEAAAHESARRLLEHVRGLQGVDIAIADERHHLVQQLRTLAGTAALKEKAAGEDRNQERASEREFSRAWHAKVQRDVVLKR